MDSSWEPFPHPAPQQTWAQLPTCSGVTVKTGYVWWAVTVRDTTVQTSSQDHRVWITTTQRQLHWLLLAALGRWPLPNWSALHNCVTWTFNIRSHSEEANKTKSNPEASEVNRHKPSLLSWGTCGQCPNVCKRPADLLVSIIQRIDLRTPWLG